MATRTFKIGLSAADRQNMAQDVYERILDLTFPEYDTTASYSVGDFVVYNNQLYKCISATSGTWDATKWQLATLNDLVEDIESAVAFVNNKANVDGNYPTMTVGNADQLNSTVYVVDKVPYLYRTSGGDADIGNREYDKIIGGSLVVNQFGRPLISTGSYWSAGGGTVVFDNTNQTATLTINQLYGYLVQKVSNIIANHKYLLMVELTRNVDDVVDILVRDYTNNVSYTKNSQNTSNKQTVSLIFTASYTVAQADIRIANNTNPYTNAHDVVVSKCYFIDLTQMFGSTIADYIYSLEQANVGAGIAWFRQYFQEEYYLYNTGAIKNVKLVSHDTVGFNQWDEETELGNIDATTGAKINANDVLRSKNYIEVLPNTTYYFKSNAIFVYEYDKNYNLVNAMGGLTNTIRTTNAKTRYLLFRLPTSYGTTYNHDICINLSWSGWRNGQYEPYQKNSYPLDATIELRGIPKLDSNNHLYFDGDEYSSDGKVVRRYGIYTFTGNEIGTNWRQNGDNYGFIITPNYPYPAKSLLSGNIIPNLLMADWQAGDYNGAFNGTDVNTVSIVQEDSAFGNRLVFRSKTITTWQDFLSAITGKTIIYELATSNEETAATFQEPQIVDDFGTEEYVVPTQDGWQIPVGHDTKYPANLRDKLQRLPDMPSVSQNVTETYVVNYNGTTKKCTFVDIASWLDSNGYEKQVDLSSGITDIAGLTYTVKKLYKAGNVVTLSMQAINETGSSIASQTKLFQLPSGAFVSGTNIYVFARKTGSNTTALISWEGKVSLENDALSNDDVLNIYVSYAVA